MDKIMVFCLAICMAVSVNAQNKEERNTANFTAISVGVPADVIISKGKDHKVVIEGNSDNLTDIKTEVKNGILKINNENSKWFAIPRKKRHTKIFITTPTLTAISLSGSGNVTSNDIFSSAEFNANISGSGKIDLRINVEEIDMNITGSGKIKLSGNSKKAKINFSGSGEVEAEEFRISEADINMMGSGSCRLHVTERLNSRIMGSGNIYFAGDPKHVNNNSMGSGRISKL